MSARQGKRGDKSYLVTMVLTASSVPVGLIMNQNKTFVMLTIQMDYCKGMRWDQKKKGENERRRD